MNSGIEADQTPAGPLPHWREGETLIKWAEDVFTAPKTWSLLQALGPSSEFVEAWEAQIHIITKNRELLKREPLWLQAHREESGTRILTLTAEGGRQVIRRGHIGDPHEEPGGGFFVAGAHIHFPTTVFRDIGSRGRSRVYPWSIDPRASLKEAIIDFARLLNIRGRLDQSPLLLGGS